MVRPLLMSILMALLVTTTTMAYPKAGDQPERWQLTFDAGDLRFFRDQRTDDGYWVLVYEVMNEDGEDHIWAPSLDLVTDRGEVIADVEDVPRRVYLTILDILGDPLLQQQSDTIGPLLRGPEHARRGLVIWPAGNEVVRQVQVFVRGVSGDTAEVIDPHNGEKVVLRRQLHLSWGVPGSLDELALKPLPRRPVGRGVSVRRPAEVESGSSTLDRARRRWVFR